ncbi:helix-turn-helix domain-containing protein [Lonepinella sp. BR2474]|uniref:helix-turn-helix domain-containing protein n=1 Tax=Lonepinella sp. BR2474 TaxID=3434548 RepID=UPI003F6E126A
MNVHTHNVQIVNDTMGNPLVAILPYTDYVDLLQENKKPEPTVPHEVVGLVVVDGLSPLQAWRKYLNITQSEVARRLGISQPAYAKYEKAKQLKSAIKEKVAKALKLAPIQLDF